MDKKVILYVGFYSLPNCDAAANRVFNNAKAFVSCGYKVIFIDEHKDYKYKDFYNSKHTINGVDIWSLRKPINIKMYIKKMMSIRHVKFITQQYKKIDLIVAYNYPSIALSRLRKYSKKNSIKIVSDCTEWYSGKEYRFPLNILCAIDSFVRMRVIQPKLDGIICVSSYLEKYYKNKTKTIKIPPLVDIEEDIWYQDKINFDNQKINLVYGGNPGRCKDLIKPIVYAINKCENSKNIILRIVGVTKEQYLNMNPEDSKYIKSNIIFLGRISHEENVRIVSSSDYLVFIREKNRVSMAGFSTKFVEAITSNIAVITTDTSDIKEYIDKLNKGIVLKDIGELSNVILEISKLSSEYKELNIKEKSVTPCDIFDYRSYSFDLKKWIETIF